MGINVKEEAGLPAGVKIVNAFLVAIVIAVCTGFIYAFDGNACRSTVTNIIIYSLLLLSGGLYLATLVKGDNSTRVNLVVATFSLVFTLVLLELALQWFIPSPYQRALFWSSTHFQADENGAVRYLPGQKVRTVAVYNGEIEYDVKYEVNNLGLIDDEPYQNRDNQIRGLLFVGDSFTAGHHGGTPWVPELRDRIRADSGIEIYNLGVTGTGVQHFAKLIDSVSEQLSFTDIVVLAISDDFLRSFWQPLISGDEIRFCRTQLSTERCLKCQPPVAHVIPFDASGESIISSVPKFQKTKNVFEKSRILSLIQNGYRGLKGRRVVENKIKTSIDSLRAIESRYPDKNIYLVHLPEKHEVAQGQYEFNLSDSLSGSRIAYFPALQECKWSLDMFHDHDSHPNRKGYEAISECVASYLKLTK